MRTSSSAPIDEWRSRKQRMIVDRKQLALCVPHGATFDSRGPHQMSSNGDALSPLNQVPPLRDLVHQRLEELIIEGKLPPGSKLREGELAATLRVSRGPIREAFQILAQDGYVDLRPRQGAYVHAFSRREVDDLFDLRRLLEAESARLAALKATPSDHMRLRSVIAQARSLVEQAVDLQAGSTWMGIHGEIAAVADNALLSSTLEALEKRFRWFLSPFEISRAHTTWEEHAAIIESIIAGDADAAKERMIAHIDHSREAFYARSGNQLP
ncbi:MAG: GntR family transcriptional regulator [Microbacteriaceae bacterium]|nr:GntR family transcriptional regulator [Microbacteriaceae bacterium]